jgi:hypothetical protein
LLTKSIKGTPLAEASAKFKRRQEQARDGLAAAAEYESAAVAMRDKTAKLRALRLAKEAEDAANAPEVVEKPKKKKKKVVK